MCFQSPEVLLFDRRMAIEFNCPYCSAMIRVPDNAGGGKGKCPRCARRITVPKVSTKAAPKAPNPDDLFIAPESDEPVVENQDDSDVTFATASPDEFAEAAGDEFAPATVDVFAPAPRPLGQLPVEAPRRALPAGSIASKLKKKKSGGNWLIPVGFGLVLIGAVGWFVWQQYQSERLVGELTAEFAGVLELDPADVDRGLFKQSPEELKEALEQLEKSSVPFNSPYMQVLIGANKRTMEVRLNAGVQTQFYRVETQNDPALINYRKKHSFELEEYRVAELERAGTDFINDYKKVLDKSAAKSSLNDYRNSLGLTALARGLGLQVEAIYGQSPYRCVYEDREGALYFLLPPGAKGFEIRGRKFNGKVVFSGKYQVKVKGELKPPSTDKAESAIEKKKKKVKPLESLESEKGDSEEMKKEMEMDKEKEMSTDK